MLKARVVSICFKCFKCFRGILQVFHTDVAKVDRGCCICCNSCTHMLQASVPNILSVFSDVCCKCVYLDIAYIFRTYVAYVIVIFKHF
jgi:hypothetical protein